MDSPDAKSNYLSERKELSAARFRSRRLVIEIDGESLRYRQRFLSKLQGWLTLGLLQFVLRDVLNRTTFTEGEISINVVTSFRADPGFPLLGMPSISLDFLVDSQRRTSTFYFSRYFLAPHPDYVEMVEHLRMLGIRDDSTASSKSLRMLAWLFIPISIFFGWSITRNQNRLVALFGALLILFGVLLVCGVVIEVSWVLLRAACKWLSSGRRLTSKKSL